MLCYFKFYSLPLVVCTSVILMNTILYALLAFFTTDILICDSTKQTGVIYNITAVMDQ